jgi:hypothetical protein
MLTIFDKVGLLATKTSKSPDFIKEMIGITPEIEKELRSIEEIKTLNKINEILQKYPKSHGIVYVEICRKWQHLNAIEEAATEIIRLGNRKANHTINLLIATYVNNIQ